MSIHILPSEVASQIAAGEVIERPASVVKELLENSIDAGAKFIAIQVEGAGKRVIEVADDGCGILAQELALAVERHATSKLQSADDLFRIRTLGFRGEALASIGSVARLTIISRPAESEMGALLRVEGGAGEAVKATGAPVGTVVRVENLFFNVPARLKFLKTDTTEGRQIDTLVTRYALAYPDIRFQLKQEGKPALQTSGNGKRREVLAALYGVDVARQMLEVLAEEEGLDIRGFISPTALTRSNRREIIFFVNGRPVQDTALVAALIKAYHTFLMVGRYPLGILFLDTPAESVDVNVHPTKAEVRFRDPSRVFSGVQVAVRRALLAHTPIPRLENQLRWTAEPDWEAANQKTYPDWQTAQEIGPQIAPDDFTPGSPSHSTFQTVEANQSLQPGLEGARIPLLRLVGQIASAYLVAEGPDGLYLIDQHAAHERVLFERFMAQRSGDIPSQVLLQPATVELPAASARLLEPQLPMLQQLGFEVEIFGSNTYLVRAIPDLLSGSDPAAALRVLVEDFEEDEKPLRDEVEARIIARVCKRAAVKAGHTLSPQEQKSLLTDLENCQSPRTCPHGRPTMIHLSVDLLERQFGRRGAR
jgi:DNA mismatch repair protein MutL